jgi:dihydrofolate synthase/folylpolyglutamate synthase
MGGRLDATRICHASLTVVTTIDRDHTSELGHELHEIAREKGAIARVGAPLLLGSGTDPVREVFEEQARELGVQTCLAADLVRVEGTADDGWGIRGEARMADSSDGRDEAISLGYHLPLAGEHMLANLTTALGAIVLLRQSGVPIEAEAVTEGIARVDWPGRLQAVPTPSGSPELLLDVGHTPSAVKQVLQEIGCRRPGSRLNVVLAVATDKEIDDILRCVLKSASVVVLTAWEGPRASDPHQLADAAGRIAGDSGEPPRIKVEQDPLMALTCAARSLGEEDVVLVIGSHMLVGAILSTVREAGGMDPIWRE